MFGGTPLADKAGSGRRELAEWLLGPARDLTARVMVNRIWQHHFGVGLVATPNDFGTRGSPPVHPELLDWLAGKFIASGWSVKALHRLIVTSETYRQSCLNAGIQHQVLRPASRRLSAEEIRDSILAISGDLDRAPGQAHPFPAEKDWNFTQHAPFIAVYDHNKRSVYLMVQRIKRHPFLALFDGADTNTSTAQRHTTTVPTQALFFLNDPFVHAKSLSLARRLEALPDDAARLERACWLMYSRASTSREQEVATRFLNDYAEAQSTGAPAERRSSAWAGWLRVMFASNEFIYVD
jgi:hypothetical protein